MRRILVPIDGSEPALRALQHAIRSIQGEPDAEIVLLTVHPPLRVYGQVQIFVGEEKSAAMAAQHDREILDNGEQILRAAKVRFSCHAEEGDAGAKIAEFVDRKACTEVVMGSRGLGRVAGLVTGSVATQVIHRVTVPVTLVR